MKAHLGFLEHLLDALGLIKVRRGEHLGREIEEVAAFGNDGLAAQHEVPLNFVSGAHGSEPIGSEKRLAHGRVRDPEAASLAANTAREGGLIRRGRAEFGEHSRQQRQ